MYAKQNLLRKKRGLLMEAIMQYTSDEFIESITAATGLGEVKWAQGSEKLQALLEEIFGDCSMLYSFEDQESGADVVLAAYQYYEGEEEAEEFIKDGLSVLLVDVEAGEVLHEINDDDLENEALFEQLVAAIKGQ